MDKVFEALEEIGNIDLGDNPYKTFEDNKLKNVYNKEFAILYNALTELKAIKESNPSEALEKVDHILSLFGGDKVQIETMTLSKCNILTIKSALLKAQENEKENAEYKEVLRIIFEKNVDINYLKHNTLHDYNCHILARDRLDTKNQLTEEEFNLLKHYLEKNIQKQ